MNKLEKIAIIMPKGAPYRYSHNNSLFSKRVDSLTIPALVGLIPKDLNIWVEIYDETLEIIEKEKINVDLVVISALTPTIHRAYAYADFFRSKNVPVVIGGIHATLATEEVSMHADAVISGIAVKSWPQLLYDFKAGKMQKIYSQDASLSGLKWAKPDRNCYINKGVFPVSINAVQATYGCKNVCEFCVQPYVAENGIERPIEDVIEEIKEINSFIVEFYDPNLTRNIKYFEKLCKAMIPLKKKWVAPTTINLANDDKLLDLAVKSGCIAILIGFESINQDSLSGISKNFNSVENFYKAVKKFQKKGIIVMGSFVLGLDNDDKDVFAKTLDFITKANIDVPKFTINTPYPGTPFYKKMKQENRIIEDNWAMYDCSHVVIQPKNMSPEELQEKYYWLWENTYKISSILKRLLFRPNLLMFFILIVNIKNHFYSKNISKYTKDIVTNFSDI